MIDKKTLDIEWLNEVSRRNRKADKILIEKVIRALFLLEGLVKVKLDFIFIGGTALMLVSDTPNRLSIDIDIILEEEPGDLEKIFSDIVAQQYFTRFEIQERIVDSKIKKSHYKFFYKPVHQTRTGEEYILLDILFEKSAYQDPKEYSINSRFVISEGDDYSVLIPSQEDLLGDKLTAFAPNTTGIPYFKNKQSMNMEIMKQLYDISGLVENTKDLDIVSNTFKSIVKKELEYRGKKDLDYHDVLEDIFQTSLCLVSRGAAGHGNFDELKAGIQRVSHYIFSESFHIDKAITCASKAAYVATAIRNNQKTIETYTNPDQMKDWSIIGSLWQKINRLKGSNPEAFYYWYKIHSMVQSENV